MYFRAEFWCVMTEEQKKILNDFELRVKNLIAHCDKLKYKNKELEEKIALQDDEIEKMKVSIREWTLKYDNLKLAKIISTDDEEMKRTKKRLSGIVREIDKCIALLNE